MQGNLEELERQFGVNEPALVQLQHGHRHAVQNLQGKIRTKDIKGSVL